MVKYSWKGKNRKVVLKIATPSLIIKLLKQMDQHGIKTGISNESTNYLGLKEKLKIIDPDKC